MHILALSKLFHLGNKTTVGIFLFWIICFSKCCLGVLVHLMTQITCMLFCIISNYFISLPLNVRVYVCVHVGVYVHVFVGIYKCHRVCVRIREQLMTVVSLFPPSESKVWTQVIRAGDKYPLCHLVCLAKRILAQI